MVSRAALPALGGPAPVLMGIVNVTPDSFSDGGRFAETQEAVRCAKLLAAEGAGIIDIGGESTRPGFQPVSAAEECRRILPVLDALDADFSLPLSIDTTKADVARRALAMGAAIINDIWGLQGDPEMATAIAEAGAAVVVMHNRRTVEPGVDVADDLERFFTTSLDIARRAGIATERIMLDPGIGFGKTPLQQIKAVRAIPLLRRRFGLPVLAGLSRKSMLGHITGSTVDRRLPETIAANLAAYAGGATLFRVHEVAPHAAAFAVYEALRPRDKA